MAEGLRSIGSTGDEPPRRPVLRRGPATLVTLATLGPDGRPTWHGLWVEAGTVHRLGPAVPASTGAGEAPTPEGTRGLLDLIAASSLSILERLEEIGGRIDALEATVTPAPLAELAEVQRALARARKHLFRLEVLLAELEGPLAREFPGVGAALPELTGRLSRTAGLASGLQQAARDLTALRAAVEANRLAEAANGLGRTSNEIAALANNSNLRMLGVAYVALALALVSAVVLIPNTAATILGMPSAAWVPGLWVDAALAVLAVVPLLLVFSRPWVRRMLSGWGEYEQRSAQGLSGLPEVPPEAAERPREAERLIQARP